MKVIARCNGPKDQNGDDGMLKKGKEYDVIEWSYQENYNGLGSNVNGYQFILGIRITSS